MPHKRIIDFRRALAVWLKAEIEEEEEGSDELIRGTYGPIYSRLPL